MLEDIREKSQGMTAKIILGLIIVTFAVAGINSGGNSVDTAVAEVNGHKISKVDFDKAYQNQLGRMEQQFGQMFETLTADPTYMANFRNGVLDNLISQALLDQNAADLSINISDERLKETIREMPEFQVDGAFNNDRYMAVIRQAGFFQSSDFRNYLQTEMVRRQLSQGLVSSEFNLPYQEAQFTKLQNQKRDVRFATITAEQFKSSIEITDEEINAYYLANQPLFQNKEQVKVEYLVLDVNDIAKNVEVSDEEVATYYQENLASYTQAEQRRVAHILIETSDDEDAAKSTAESVLVRLNEGEDFAEVAKEVSADTFSAENGGDLDFIEPGLMDPAFDESAFELANVGDISTVVQTEFGFHIIKLTDLIAEEIKPFEEVSEEIKATVSNNKAQDEFYELQQEMAQISFELPDSLDDAAQAVNLTVQTSDWLSRDGNSAPFNNPQVIDALFSGPVLNENVNSDVVEVNSELAMVVRLNEYQAAEAKPLAEVTAQITTTLINEKATEQASNAAQDLLAQFKEGNDITQALADVNASFIEKPALARFGGDVDQSISKEAFVLPHPTEDTISANTVTLANGDLALLEVLAVIEADVSEVSPNLTQQQVTQLAQTAYSNYVDSLKVDAKITKRTITEQPSNF